MKKTFMLLLTLANIPTTTLPKSHQEIPWHWADVNIEDVSFPPSFLRGFAICEYQNSGAANCPDGNWASWEKRTKNGKPCIKDGQRSGASADFWHRYQEDIALMKAIGTNAFRFSIDWSRIEPKEGEFNQEAIKHYHDVCDALLAAGITPMITLHHFTHPMWFERKGAFVRQENIHYFVRFSKMMFNELSPKVPFWCTINEPAIYTFTGYILGIFPPGKTNLHLAGTVLKNLLKAHGEVYQALKKLPNGNNVQIGLVHNMLTFEPYHSWNPLEKIPCSYLTYFINDTTMHFLKTGTFSWHVPGLAHVSYHSPSIKKNLDFIGLNYYSRVLISAQASLPDILTPTCRWHEIMTDMQYAIYPEGFYNAIVEIAKLGVPIYITENGIADANDSRREFFLKRYLYALYKAKQNGYDVQGYFYWTLTDNFEWNEGYHMKFGLFEADPQTKKRTLRHGGECFQKIFTQQ